MSQLAKCFTDFIPSQTLQPHQSGAQNRRRLFSKELLMYFIVYNGLRLLMLKAADEANLPVR